MSRDSEEPPADRSTLPDQRTVRYEWTGETNPSIAIVEAVAAATDRDPREMPALQHALDTDALDTLIATRSDCALRLSFEYLDATVTVRQDDVIEVTL